jgi:CO/xanthine dehydrogenase Mo-binding subunit
MAIDCGTVVNPDRVRAQLEGAAIMSIGNALYSQITMKNGSVEQSNCTDYLVPRIDITPETHVYFLENTHCPAVSANRECRRPRQRSATRSTQQPANASEPCRSIRNC